MAEVAYTIDELRALRRLMDDRRREVALVPTMGALHEGHLSLISRAAESAEEVVVSVYVNPLQFGSAEDFDHYPRSLERDVALASAAGATLCFAPNESQMFPLGQPVVTVDPGPFGELLEGRSRPGHFRGVATIVTRLFALARPARAYFGEKDFEQLCVIRRLVDDLGLDVEIVAMPIVRAPDGLALSSRNERLDPDERRHATVLYRALRRGRELLESGVRAVGAVEREMAAIVAAEPGVTLDYAVVRREVDLAPPDRGDVARLRLLIAAQVGPVRLIDNIGVPLP